MRMYVGNRRGRDGAKKLDTVMQQVLLPALLEVDPLRPIACHNPSDAPVACTDRRDDVDEQVDALSVDQARQDDDGDVCA